MDEFFSISVMPKRLTTALGFIDVLQDIIALGEIITPFSMFKYLPKITDEWINERILKFLYFSCTLKSSSLILQFVTPISMFPYVFNDSGLNASTTEKSFG